MKDAAEKAGIATVGPSYIDNGVDEECRSLFATMGQAAVDALFVDGRPEHITKRNRRVGCEIPNAGHLPLPFVCGSRWALGLWHRSRRDFSSGHSCR